MIEDQPAAEPDTEAPHDLTQSPILPDVARLDPAERHRLQESGRRWSSALPPPSMEDEQRADPSVREVVRRRGGGYYVRVRGPAQFEGVEPGVLRATRLASEPTAGIGHLWTQLKHVVVGDPLTLQSYMH